MVTNIIFQAEIIKIILKSNAYKKYPALVDIELFLWPKKSKKWLPIVVVFYKKQQQHLLLCKILTLCY